MAWGLQKPSDHSTQRGPSWRPRPSHLLPSACLAAGRPQQPLWAQLASFPLGGSRPRYAAHLDNLSTLEDVSLLTLTSLLVCQPCRNHALQAPSIPVRVVGRGGAVVWSLGGTCGIYTDARSYMHILWAQHACFHYCEVSTGTCRVCVCRVCCAHNLASTSNVCVSLPSSFPECPYVFSSKQGQRGAREQPGGRGGHSPCRVSYCLICTSSTQSAGNQPVRPFTVPSQKPPSPMLSTGGTEARNAVRQSRAAGTRPPPLPPSPPQAQVLPTHPSPFLPPFPLSSWRFPWKDFGIHTEEKRTDGHSTGWACGGQRDTQMDTLEGGQEAEAGTTILLLLSQVTPLLPPHPCCHPPQGH